jgi:hypothetical protein
MIMPNRACSGARRHLHAMLVVLAFGGLLLGSGCASSRVPSVPPVTVADIVSMSQNHVPADEIIARIRASGTVYRLKADQLVKLKAEGVPDDVLNYMQETYLEAVRRDQSRRDWNQWVLEDDGFWYGGVPFGWPYFEPPYFPEEGAREEHEEHALHERHEQQYEEHEEERELNEGHERHEEHEERG